MVLPSKATSSDELNRFHHTKRETAELIYVLLHIHG